MNTKNNNIKSNILLLFDIFILISITMFKKIVYIIYGTTELHYQDSQSNMKNIRVITSV